MWKFLVKNQSIEILEREVLADHQIQYVQFKFTFDGDWKRFHKVVQFAQCDEVYSVVLGTDGVSCFLPAELHVGACKMSVFGYDTESDETVRATTVPVTLNIRASGFEGDEPPIPPTPDLYTQLLKRIEDAEKGLDGKSAYEIAVEHGFVGTEEEWLESLKGKDGITPDMSEYPKTTEVTVLIQQEVAPVAADAHTHDNKAVLDSITQEMLDDISSISTVVGQAHWHHNLTVLNSITESQVSRWDEAYTSAMNLNERVGVDEGLFSQFKTEILYDMQGAKTSITDINTRLSAVETALSGVETALADIVEVTA